MSEKTNLYVVYIGFQFIVGGKTTKCEWKQHYCFGENMKELYQQYPLSEYARDFENLKEMIDKSMLQKKVCSLLYSHGDQNDEIVYIDIVKV